ncbi:MAG: aldose epimerase family protein [Candidatus Cryptobacteroides sp.]
MEDFIRIGNGLGTEAVFTSYGARWVDLVIVGESGQKIRPVLGFDSISGYVEAGEQYHGAMVGRVCGRISGASFEMDGRTYTLEQNDSYGYPCPNHLHGGIKAFHKREWSARKFITDEGDEAVEFSLVSPDGENGYPGNVKVNVTYTLCNDRNTVRIACRAEADRKTPLSLTNHTFFNLNGHSDGMDASSHILSMSPAALIECDSELVPTGKIENCSGQWFDFASRPDSFAEAIERAPEQVRKDGGFSLAYALQEYDGTLRKAAVLTDPLSGRRLEVYTDQPSLQVYTAYFMDGKDAGHLGCRYNRTAGIALETQGYPDAVNHPEFPSIWVTPGNPYRSDTEYRFV